MARAGKRGRRIAAVMVALAALLTAAGLGWDRYRRLNDPLNRARAAYDRSDFEAATQLVRERLKTRGHDPEVQRLLARISFRQGRDAAAMSIYQRLGEEMLEPEDRFLIGMSLARSGKVRSAVSAWETAVAQAPDRPDLLFQLTRGYFALDRLPEARQAAERLGRCPGWESQAEVLLGQIELARDEPGRAADEWLKSLSHGRQTGDDLGRLVVPRTELARALLRVGRPAEARDQLRVALSEKADPDTYWLLSRADLQLKDWPAARADLERGASFRADHPLQPEPTAFVGTAKCESIETLWGLPAVVDEPT
jgi:tetratricopeptide (TPR) repeat protein